MAYDESQLVTTRESLRTGGPVRATAQHCQAPWSGHPKNFRCGFCGYKFQEGDIFRWIYTNDISGAGGNPLACEACGQDREELRKRWQAMHAEYRALKAGRFWWFLSGDDQA